MNRAGARRQVVVRFFESELVVVRTRAAMDHPGRSRCAAILEMTVRTATVAGLAGWRTFDEVRCDSGDDVGGHVLPTSVLPSRG